MPAATTRCPGRDSMSSPVAAAAGRGASARLANRRTPPASPTPRTRHDRPNDEGPEHRLVPAESRLQERRPRTPRPGRRERRAPPHAPAADRLRAAPSAPPATGRMVSSKHNTAARRHDVAPATSRRAQPILSDRSAPDRAIKCASGLPPADVPEFGTPIAKAKSAVDGWYAYPGRNVARRSHGRRGRP